MPKPEAPILTEARPLTLDTFRRAREALEAQQRSYIAQKNQYPCVVPYGFPLSDDELRFIRESPDYILEQRPFVGPYDFSLSDDEVERILAIHNVIRQLRRYTPLRPAPTPRTQP